MTETKTRQLHNGMLSKAGLNRPMKMVKMIQARCNTCNPRGQGKRGWWTTCPHDPYVTVEEKEIHHPTLGTQPDGRILKTGETIEVEYIRKPNWKQIADDPKVASARMVRIQQERGSVFPEDLGYAPICDYNNCWEENPKFIIGRVFNIEGASASGGRYHSRDEAALITLRYEETPTYVGLDRDMARRRKQMEQVNIQ